jgi:ADP-heptose:LPS heptosyltransferase
VDDTVGPLGEPIADVRRIAVLRGGGLGDLVFALPAIASLAAAHPAAEVVLLGTAGHAALLLGRPGPVREVRVLPFAEGVHEPPDQAPDDALLERFLDDAVRSGFDLAVQLHGGGRYSNPFVRRLGARVSVGARSPDAEPLDRNLPYRYYQHEVLRGLEVAGLAGAPPAHWQPRLAVTAADRRLGDQALHGLPPPVLTVHPGASDPRRRWPAERFGEVAARAVLGGAGVAVVGTADEAGLVDAVRAHALSRLPPRRHDAVRPLAGALSASALVGVLARSAVVLANDSGPRHLAQAVGTSTVGVFWIGNMINAAPFGRALHRAHVSATSRCPVCGVDCVRDDGPRCAHDPSFVADVRTEDVVADVLELWEENTGRDTADRV